MEWNKALQLSGSASPYIGDVLDKAFKKAQAVVVLFTPDDEVRLKPEFQSANEPENEKKLWGQARPNVIFEAGMAFGTHPKQTILVEIGKLKPISDIVGRHASRLDNTTTKRKELMLKLQTAGCVVDFTSDWETAGDFTP
jgi:predicted nucleotide-binding protein